MFETILGGSDLIFNTLMFLSIGTHLNINFPFVPNGKLMVLGIQILENIKTLNIMTNLNLKLESNVLFTSVEVPMTDQGIFQCCKETNESD